jgi:hypothetical protein
MKLNGWIRLGVVLSGLWLVVASTFAYFEVSTLFESRKWEISKEGVGSAIFIFPKSDPDEFVQRYINEELIPLVAKAPADYVGKTITTPYDNHIRKELPGLVTKCLLIAIVPIAVLFCSVGHLRGLGAASGDRVPNISVNPDLCKRGFFPLAQAGYFNR